ncbi:MAG: heparan-alpha-glucosaminide N-acetyltransferase [Candidatus Micrarchaeota archaeon]
MERITELDALRGVAILMMAAYHFIFDIYYLGFAQIDLQFLPILLFQRATGTLFLLLAGASLWLSERHNKEGYGRHARRGLLLAAVAALITLGTWIYPHEGFITFGIIHMIAASTFIAPLFFRFGRLNILLGLTLITAGFFIGAVGTDSRLLFPLGVTYPGYTALDYYPLIPWFGVVLVGMEAGRIIFPRGKATWKSRDSAWASRLAFLGRNSLALYLAHQPLILGAMMAYRALAP